MKKIKLLIVESDDVLPPSPEDTHMADVILEEDLEYPGNYRVVKGDSFPFSKIPHNGNLKIG